MKKDNITPLAGSSAGNTLTFPQVFFIFLIQVYIIRGVLKGKKHLFMLKRSVKLSWKASDTFLHLFTVFQNTQYSCSSTVNNVIRALTQGFKDKFFNCFGSFTELMKMFYSFFFF